MKNPMSRNYESTIFGLSSESRRGFNTETKTSSKNDEPRTLIESLYRNKENDAYYDNFSSDGESVDSEGSEDLLKYFNNYTNILKLIQLDIQVYLVQKKF